MTGAACLIEMAGRRFGRLVVSTRADNAPSGGVRWNCTCDCGAELVVFAQGLRRGVKKSCYACTIAHRTPPECNVVHGHYRNRKASKEYDAWRNMVARCHKPRNVSYGRYGARGVRVCDEWRRSFVAFLDHIGIAPSPGHSVDRIDGRRGYEPGNVRWATLLEQANNRRDNVVLEYDGQAMTLAEWSRRLGDETGLLVRRRLGIGWSTERALTQPPRRRTKPKDMPKRRDAG